jgi:hypothetical protein
VKSTSLALTLLFSAWMPLEAQSSVLPEQSRIRVTVIADSSATHTEARFTGILVTSGTGTLQLKDGDSTTSFRLGTLQRLELSQGYRTHRLLGAGVGLIAGAGLTYFLTRSGGSGSLCDRASNQDALSSSECLGVAALGGLAGAGLGALIGGLIRTEGWRDIPLHDVRFGIVPHRGMGVGVGGTFHVR